MKREVLENKPFKIYNLKKMRRMLPKHPQENEDNNCDPSIMRKLIVKQIELFCKEKEDDYEKIIRKLNKYENRILDPEYSRNVKLFWIQFKILFYANTLVKKNANYYSDDKFWKIINEFLQENSNLINSSTLKQSLKILNNSNKKR